jgi:phosphatidylglycerophosphate synthase
LAINLGCRNVLCAEKIWMAAQWTWFYLLFVIFNGCVRASWYITSNSREGSGRNRSCPYCRCYDRISWLRKRQLSVRISILWADTWSWDLPNNKQECYFSTVTFTLDRNSVSKHSGVNQYTVHLYVVLLECLSVIYDS